MLGLLPHRPSFFIGCWFLRSQPLSRFMATEYKRATLPSFWCQEIFNYVPPAFRPIMWHVVTYTLHCHRPFVIASSLCRKIQQTWAEELERRRPVFVDLTSICIQHHRQFTGVDSNLDIITVNTKGSSFLKVHHRPPHHPRPFIPRLVLSSLLHELHSQGGMPTRKK